MPEAKVGQGDVAIVLGGDEYFLVPTAGAAMALSRMSGGLRGAMTEIMTLNLDVIVKVVQLGLGPKVVKDITKSGDDLTELIYQSGLTDSTGGIAEKCTTYVANLSNGGKPLGGKKDDDDDNPR